MTYRSLSLRVLFTFALALILADCGGGDDVPPPAPPAPPGTLDSSFASNGIVTTPAGRGAKATAIALQPDGKIIIAGAALNGGQHTMVVARYAPNGSLDPTFGQGGKAVTELGPGSPDDDAYLPDRSRVGVALQPDGKIVAAGMSISTLPPAGERGCAVIRYNADGSLDSTFGDGGIVAKRSVDGSPRPCHAIAVQPDGKIVAAARNYTLFRLGADGSRDLSFGAGGEAQARCESEDDRFCLPHSLIIRPDGKIFIAGTAYQTLGDGTVRP